MSEKGNVWGLSYSQGTGRIVVSRLGEAGDNFESLESLPLGSINRFLIAFDPEWERFWFFVPGAGIYSYHPNERKLEFVNEIADLVPSQIVYKDGVIYFQEYFNDSRWAEFHMYSYSIESNSLTKLATVSGWPNNGSLFIDAKDRVWASVQGYLKSNEESFLLNPNSQAFFEQPGSPYSSTPEIIYEDTNGVFWVQRSLGTNADGIAWFYPETKTGCWFTTLSGDLIEDSRKRLYLLNNDGSFYLLQIAP